jgi:outer membrane protein OmpA-like peptidoglycan-associated protein
MDAPEPQPEILAKRDPGPKTDEPSSISFARRAPPELTIYFVRDSNDLRPSETDKLDKVVQTISQQPELRLILNGYTDSVGSTDYNVMIAEGRASSIKLYLVAKGVNPLHIIVAGKGARDFVATNDREEGRSLNRRVEIQLDRGR